MVGPWPAHASNGPFAQESVQVTRQVFLMGTRCTLTAEAPGRASGRDRLESLLGVLEQTEAQLSTWRPDSRLTMLNQTPPGKPFSLSGPLCRLFEDLYSWHSRTLRAFDPAVGNLIQAWGLRQGGRLPSATQIGEALQQSGLEHLAFDPSSCQLVRLRRIVLDAGAFGKGAALDRARKLSIKDSLAPWMINLGGQVMVEGRPSQAPGWRVDVAHPAHRQQAVMQVVLTEGSLAVSGGSERDLKVRGQSIGHILDPRNGRPADYSGSVAAWHPSALAADILSTALYVLGEEEGFRWAQDNEVAACFLTLSPAGLLRTKCSTEFRRRFSWDPG